MKNKYNIIFAIALLVSIAIAMAGFIFSFGIMFFLGAWGVFFNYMMLIFNPDKIEE